MGNKSEIGWVRPNANGVKEDVFARQVGREWRFFARRRRYDQWQRIPEPSLEDWLVLLDGVRRRVVRRMFMPDDEVRLVALIRNRFPEWKEN
jgi:hypothetical protein